VRTTTSYGIWRRKTIERAISIWGLIRITRVAGDVEFRSPAQECLECHERTEVLVKPEGLCGTCWSRKVIGAWQVTPLSFRVAEMIILPNRRGRRARR
jgi:hypothetical protein